MAELTPQTVSKPLRSWEQVYSLDNMWFTGSPIGRNEGGYEFHNRLRLYTWHFNAVAANPHFATGAELWNLYTRVVPSFRETYPDLVETHIGEAALQVMRELEITPDAVEKAWQASIEVRAAHTPDSWAPIKHFHTAILRPIYLALRARGFSHAEIIG